MCAGAETQEQPFNTAAVGRKSRNPRRTSTAIPPSKTVENSTAEPVEAGAGAAAAAHGTAAIDDTAADVVLSERAHTRHVSSSQGRSSRAATTAAAKATSKHNAADSSPAAARAAAATKDAVNTSAANAPVSNGVPVGCENGQRGRSSGSSTSSVQARKAASQLGEAAPSARPLSEATTAVTVQPTLDQVAAPAATPGSELAARIGTGLQSLQVRARTFSSALSVPDEPLAGPRF